YTIRLHGGRWECTCHTFESNMLGTCSHIMALQQLLGVMLPDDARYGVETVEPVGASAG
ncbi:MAG: hypothetical protein IT337_03875, partial [Thermomicrobiales bacterium]|nr:hypothetical protein [Thermomicrobiales bacterium]